MDSNLINIDDLVKQRLGGGEERERSGAWLRMQELLEQEERKKPFGIIFWRRAMTAVGVIMLVALLSVGGYKVTTAFRGPGADVAGNDNATSHESNTLAAAANGTAGHQTASNQDVTAADGTNVGANDVAATNTDGAANNADVAVSNSSSVKHSNAVVTATKHTDIMKHATASTAGVSTIGSSHNNGTTSVSNIEPVNTPVATKAAIAKSTTTANNATTNNNSATGSVAKVESANDKVATATTEKKVTEKASLNTAATTTNNSTATAKIAKSTNATPAATAKNGKATAEVAVTTAATTKTIIGDNAATKKVANTTNTPENGTTEGKVATASVSGTTKGHQGVKMTKAETGKASIAAHNVNGNEIATTDVAATASVKNKVPATTTKPTAKVEEVAVNKMHLGAVTTTATTASVKHNNNAIASISAIKNKTANNGAATMGNVNANASVSKATATTKHNSVVNATKANNIPAAKTLNAAASVAKTEATVAAKPANVTTKVVQKINTHQTTTGSYPGRLQMHNDTISIDKETVVTKTAEVEEAPAEEDATVSVLSSGGAAPSTTKTAGKLKGTNGVAKKGTVPLKGSKPGTLSEATGTAVTTATSGQSASKTTASVTAPASKGHTSYIIEKMKPVLPQLSAMPPFSAPAPKTTALPKQTPLNPADEDGNGLIADKKKSAQFVADLLKTFNDIKYKIGGAKFAPGLTAGIDGTFFGPNSCKGFQFGVTANFELDDKWSFLTELKYFHRMNNTFFMHVTYDNYTPAANGGYYKDPTEIDYTFATLHSFELPMSLRYAAGKFNFFGGANVLYTLGVNVTGDPTRQFPTQAPTLVTEIGANNTPSLQVSNFGGRFGIGYLCGLSYAIAPNMQLDFRNVQTVWDNSKPGATRYVSTQLFKSPSLQFSLFYRFGHKDDEK